LCFSSTKTKQALLDKGANVDGLASPAPAPGFVVMESEIEKIPLLAAARSNKLDVLRLLLDRGANIEVLNKQTQISVV
jgi:hypothetical protein